MRDVTFLRSDPLISFLDMIMSIGYGCSAAGEENLAIFLAYLCLFPFLKVMISKTIRK